MTRPSLDWRRAAGTVATMLAIGWITFVSGLAFWSVLPTAFGWHPELVLTGSMEPRIKPGDVVLVSGVSEPVAPGHIVLVADSSRSTGTYLHRVVRYDDAGNLITKGDANQSEDVGPVTQSRVRGEARLLVPAIGRPVVWLHEGRFGPFVLVLAATWGSAVVCFGGSGLSLPGRGPGRRPSR